MPFHITIVENLRDRALLESQPRYDVCVNGVKVDQLYFNVRGYCGSLPLPDGTKLSMPEGGISRFRHEAAVINREARQVPA